MVFNLAIFGGGEVLSCSNARFVRIAGGTRIVGSDQSGFAIPGDKELPGFAEINDVDADGKNTRDSKGYETVAQDERLYLKNLEGNRIAFSVDARIGASGIPRGNILVHDLTLDFTVESPIAVFGNHGAFNEMNGFDCNGRNLPFAKGVLTLGGNVLDGNTVVIYGKTYTAQDTLTDVDGKFLIGASASDTLDNLIDAINLGAGSGVRYAASTTLHPSVRAAAGAGDTMDAFAVQSGSSPNSLTTTAVLANGSWGGATLSGGNVEVCSREGVFVSDQVGFLFDMDSGGLSTQVRVNGETAPETERRQFDNGPFFLGTEDGNRLETVCMELRQKIRFKARPGPAGGDNPICSVRAKTHQWKGEITSGGYTVIDNR